MVKRVNSEVLFLRELITTLTRQNEAMLAQNQKLIELMTGQVNGQAESPDAQEKLRKIEDYIADVDGANHDEELGDTERK